MDELSQHFNRLEFACKGIGCCGGSAPISRELVRRLEIYRQTLGDFEPKPDGSISIKISSGFRCLTWNCTPAKYGGPGSYPGSQHPKGTACDILAQGRDIERMVDLAKPIFEYVKAYDWGIHVDVRGW